MKEQEELEQRQKELDRSVCKVMASSLCDFSTFVYMYLIPCLFVDKQIKLFCRHPTDQKMMELRLEVHKDKTLEEATGIAYEVAVFHCVLYLLLTYVFIFPLVCSKSVLSVVMCICMFKHYLFAMDYLDVCCCRISEIVFAENILKFALLFFHHNTLN